MISGAIGDSSNQAAKQHKDTNLNLEFVDSKEAIFIEAGLVRCFQIF